ncbi:hypothetical protein HOH87_03360 [bacterium]|jgi:glycerol kinase|nr:hypothetical protein [bacterium]
MPPKKNVLVIDQTPTKITATIYDARGAQIGSGEKQVVSQSPQPRWAQYDAQEVFYGVQASIQEAIHKAQINPNTLVGMGLTMLSDCVVAWNPKTGKAYTELIAPHCLRAEGVAQAMNNPSWRDDIVSQTGQRIEPYSMACKIKWMNENHESVIEVNRNEKPIVFGSVSSWILFNLTGKKSLKMDGSEASRSQLMAVSAQGWSPLLCDYFGVDPKTLPDSVPNVEYFGMTRKCLSLPDGVPIYAVLPQHYAAFVGHCAGQLNVAYLHFGELCRLMVHTGQTHVSQKDAFLAIRLNHGKKPSFGLEGYTASLSSMMPWLNVFHQNGRVHQLAEEEFANLQIKEGEDLLIYPITEQRTSQRTLQAHNYVVKGLGPATTKRQLMAGALACLAYQIKSLLNQYELISNTHVTEMIVDGDLGDHEALLQWLSDVLQITITRLKEPPNRSGIALLIGQKEPVMSKKPAVQNLTAVQRRMAPNLDPLSSYTQYSNWEAAIQHA